MKDAPERLDLNFMTRPQAPITGASGRASMETGVAFTLGNMAKEGPSSILRMPIFGPRFGVRAFVAEPLAGNEISVSCLGSVSESEAAVLDNEARRSRLQEKKKKETTALCNKKATLKVDQCQPHGGLACPQMPKLAWLGKKLRSRNQYVTELPPFLRLCPAASAA
jgi:hypothetical protein